MNILKIEKNSVIVFIGLLTLEFMLLPETLLAESRHPDSVKTAAETRSDSEKEYKLWKARLSRRSKDFYLRQERLKKKDIARRAAVSESIERRKKNADKRIAARKAFKRKTSKMDRINLEQAYLKEKKQRQDLLLIAGKLRSEKKKKLSHLKEGLERVSEEEEFGIQLKPAGK